MPISSGTRVGPYEVISHIGAGGMGEVYRAKDTRLGREVAIKILPEQFSQDRNRLIRFEQEARSASALNHPNIITIYDIGSSEPGIYIAMELIEGKTLRETLNSGSLPLRKTLHIATQLADALAKAHETGIIHRDLKPENFMINKDGFGKILDFGLAKISLPKPEDVSYLSTQAQTQAGIILGTAAYMSPEQAAGKPVDFRSDQFSFGTILYEMVTGKNPFQRNTMVDTLAAIINEEPKPVSSLNSQVPLSIQGIIERCLAKNCEDRYASTRDLAKDLHLIQEKEEFRRSGPSGDVQVVRKARKKMLLISSLLIASAVAGFLFWRNSQETSSQIPFQKVKLTRLTSSGTAREPAISPDGKYVTYLQESKTGGHNLYLKQLTSDTEILLIRPSPDTYLWGGQHFSNDGEYIYYLTWTPSKSKKGSLYQIPVLGGISQKIIEDIELVTISSDGKRFAFIRKVNNEEWLMTARIDGSEERKIRSHKLPNKYDDIAWSPDGKIIAAIYVSVSQNGSQTQIVEIRLNDGSQQPFYKKSLHFEAWNDLEWLPDGRGLVLTTDIEGKNQIGLLSYPDGALSSITNDYNHYGGVSLTRDAQSLVTTQIAFHSALWVAASAKPDAVTQITTGSTEDGNTGLSWTPDGKILYRSTMPSEEYQICLINSDGTNRQQITTGLPNKHWPIASPDGRTIVYNTEEEGQSIMKIWRMNMDGSDPKVVSHRKQVRWPRFSPDSKWIVFSTWGQEKQALIKLKLEDAKEITLATHPHILGAAISSNGSQIAYVHEENQRFILNIISSENGALLKTIALAENAIPNGRIHWTPDGRGISYIVHKADVSNIFIQPIDGSPPKQFTHFTSDMIGNYSWSMDGKQIVYSRGKDPITDIVLIQSLP